MTDVAQRLTTWLTAQLPAASALRVEGLDRVEFGHSAEMLLATITWRAQGKEHRQDVVVRLQPRSPSLLEPCDLARQFTILRALESTAVHSPRALWLEESGDILSRPFYVMARLPGEAYELTPPAGAANTPELTLRMSEQIIDELAAIHLVDVAAVGLSSLGDGSTYVDDELDHWSGEMRRVARGPLPALERLLTELRDRRPTTPSLVTLVHGDAKPGNYAFADGQLTAVFDWELATLGDPLADLGWAEINWPMTPAFANVSAQDRERLLQRYAERTGFTLHDRDWYRAFQTFKLSVIMLLAGMLFDAGHTDDPRLGEMGLGVAHFTRQGLAEFDIDERIDPGPYKPRAMA